MNSNFLKFLSFLSFLIIPILSLCQIRLLSIMGSQPYWPIFWLLPWAIVNGPIKTTITGLIIGLVLDSINNDLLTQIPGLMLCGFWFGRIGKISKSNFLGFKYGLIASIGTFICGFIYFLQLLLNLFIEKSDFWLIAFGIKNIFAQVLLTGLLAPVFCTWLFFLFCRKDQIRL